MATHLDKQTETPRQCEFLSTETRISSVPDKEFERPQTIEELAAAAHLASDILYAVAMRLVSDGAAWQIVNQAHQAAVDAYCWICAAKWIGLSDWQKRKTA